MTQYSIAIDIGASSGRLIHGYVEDEVMKIEEVHRFENKLIVKQDTFIWDVDRLFEEIKNGLRICRDRGLQVDTIGIDTWAVDFVLLDENGERLTDAVAYRDKRTDGMMEEVFALIPKEQLYFETGIQFQKFNTIYQLQALKKSNPEVFERAKHFLMIPDYLNYLLTGQMSNEYTNATSTQLLNAFTKRWDTDLLQTLGMNPELFQEILPPKTILGSLKKELAVELGMNPLIVLPATHDTGSAIISVPEQDAIYLSSGTWSLMGVENRFPICTKRAEDFNFTNEGGIDYRFRFLKNIMGLWMIQEVKRNYENQYSFADLVKMAKETDFQAIVDVNDDRFLKPANMIISIQTVCKETGQAIPQTPGEVAKCVYDSLASCYHKTILEIEAIYDRSYDRISVIGGGSQNELLNQTLANISGKEVYAGPIEATAIGNIVAQQMALGVLDDIDVARQIIRESFEVKRYWPVSPVTI
ncbi:MAG: rhamnulokinase [Exiguobacterium marinum]|uniref:rhamnulokinase n=1 Tax=Exiguobacterium marinum TaxID=273528 RepID=UPI003C5438E8